MEMDSELEMAEGKLINICSRILINEDRSVVVLSPAVLYAQNPTSFPIRDVASSIQHSWLNPERRIRQSEKASRRKASKVLRGLLDEAAGACGRV